MTRQGNACVLVPELSGVVMRPDSSRRQSGSGSVPNAEKSGSVELGLVAGIAGSHPASVGSGAVAEKGGWRWRGPAQSIQSSCA